MQDFSFLLSKRIVAYKFFFRLMALWFVRLALESHPPRLPPTPLAYASEYSSPSRLASLAEIKNIRHHLGSLRSPKNKYSSPSRLASLAEIHIRHRLGSLRSPKINVRHRLCLLSSPIIKIGHGLGSLWSPRFKNIRHRYGSLRLPKI